MTSWDGLRLAFGTLTVLPTPAPGTVDRRVAGQAMLLAPAVGVVIGGSAAAVVAGVHAVKPETPLLAAVLGVVVLTVLSGALHLDGLADTADAFGSRRDRETKLRIMKQSDIGPFGVVAIMVVLLVDVAALSACVQAGFGWQAVLVAAVVGRLTLPWSCRTGVPSARPDGLGAMVAATVRLAAAVLVTLVALALLVALVWLVPPAPAPSSWVAVSEAADPMVMTVPAAHAGSELWRALVGTGTAVLLAVAFALISTRRARRSLGGITGDTLGATVEFAVPVALLALALAV
ncbi:cobalamin-5-phosphate synthase CobS [Kribbella flavida DSM 17836]|uniref:Adenosylcobinamide-GDP ribazoletransferase n=1 Tax=Kribbella flavida (strain DSM 17836 / JCM 10339 / NBRC 14399) TaxID=479435 RepID=D2PYX7_KRIFD|nr:adenosylcobinamide-GDP ribazoletransferase [Kribbella flavida]ADB31771.1 cobalamin-5-phosphate synthase CobS [Kribbella flavida DSM 17836]